MKNFNVKNLSVLLTVVLFAIFISGCATSKDESPPKNATVDEKIPLKIATIQAEKTSLKIGTPVELEDFSDLGNLGDAEAFIKKLVMKTATDKDLDIMACGYVFDKKAVEAQTGQPFTPNLEGALLGAVNNVNAGSSGVVVSVGAVTDVTVNGMHGKEINGSMDAPVDGNTNAEIRREFRDFRMMAFSKGDEMWTVMIIRKPNDKSKRISDAVFNSLKILSGDDNEKTS